MSKELIRAAGGIVHSDGNIFFTNRHQFEHAASLACGTATIAAPAAQAVQAVPREYYYQVTGCPALDSDTPDCICWHKEGTGPFADTPDKVRSWRNVQSTAAPQPPAKQDVSRIVAGALFDFMGMLTSQPEKTKFSDCDDAAPAVAQIEKFAAKRGLSLDEADVKGWSKSLAAHSIHPAATPEKVDSWADYQERCEHGVRWENRCATCGPDEVNEAMPNATPEKGGEL